MARRIIKIDSKSALPKYRQIISSVQQAIEKKTLKKGDKVPSINQICTDFNLSRDTVMLAFNELKSEEYCTVSQGKDII
jgi:DNA-binding transcriptional regulator YhcF (GntR family)